MKLYYFHTARGAIAARSYEPQAQRPGLIRGALFGLALLVLALCTAAPVHAQAAYSPRLAAERQEAVRSVILTRQCMFEASQALIRQGVVKPEALAAFAAAACGSRMRVFLVGIAKWPQADAETLIKVFAASEAESALSWGR